MRSDTDNKKKNLRPGSIRAWLSGLLCTVVFLFAALNYKLFGRGVNGGDGRLIIVFFFLLLAAAATWLRCFYIIKQRRSDASGVIYKRPVRLPLPASLAAALFHGVFWYYTLEVIFNRNFLRIEPKYVLAGVVICFFMFLALLLLFNSLLAASIAGTVFYFVWAVAEFYTQSVRGLPVQIHDLTDITTAMDVAGDYTFSVNAYIITMGALGALICINLLAGKRYVLRTAGERALEVRFAGAVLMAALAVTLVYDPAFDRLGVGINGNRPGDSFRQFGTQLAFIKGIRDSRIEAPEGYSPEKLREAADEYRFAASAPDTEEPNIIVIMNETFADVDIFGRRGLADEVLPNYSDLSGNVLKGKLMVSTLGGGTGKSEYEFLTGNSMHLFSSFISPYVMLGSRLKYSMPAVLSSQGYTSFAIHPYTASNYNRQNAYKAMGFDQFLSEDDFKDAEKIRKYVSDRECYKKIIDLASETDRPLFTFCVTIQNHSPYNMKGYDPDVRLEGIDDPVAEQYLSLLKESDRQIRYLIDSFDELDEKTMIVFFGDHFPKLSDDFWEYITGVPVDQQDFQTQQQYYTTPFFIWSNYDIEGLEKKDDMVMSTNYLGSYALELAGLKLPGYNRYILDLMEEVPAFSAFAFYGKDGLFHRIEDDESVKEKIRLYDCFQYNELFDRKNRVPDFFGFE